MDDITSYVCNNYNENNELIYMYENDVDWNEISKIIKDDLEDFKHLINWNIYFQYCEFNNNFDLDILDRIKDYDDLDWVMISKKVNFGVKGLDYFKYYIKN